MSENPANNQGEEADPIAVILRKLDGKGRLERKLDAATTQIMENLDYLTSEVNAISELRNTDNLAVGRVERAVKEINKDMNWW